MRVGLATTGGGQGRNERDHRKELCGGSSGGGILNCFRSTMGFSGTDGNGYVSVVVAMPIGRYQISIRNLFYGIPILLSIPMGHHITESRHMKHA